MMLSYGEQRVRTAARFTPKRSLLETTYRGSWAVVTSGLLAWVLSTWFFVAMGNDRLTMTVAGGAVVLEWQSAVAHDVTWVLRAGRYAGAPLWCLLPQWAGGDDGSTGLTYITEVCPLWVAILAAGTAAFISKRLLAAIDITNRARDEGRCIWCLYDLRGNSTGRCPECGHTVVPSPGQSSRPVLSVSRVAHIKQHAFVNLGIVLTFLVLLACATGGYQTHRSWDNRISLALVGLLGPVGWFSHATFGKMPIYASLATVAGMCFGANWLVWRTRSITGSSVPHMIVLLVWALAGMAEVWFLSGNWPE